MQLKLEDDDNIEVQMAPLIDCVFLLLIFFLIASTLKKTAKELPIELPDAAVSVTMPVEKNMLIIAVDRAGVTYLGTEPVGTETLLGRLRQAEATTPNIRIRIDGDRMVPYQHIVRLVSELQFHGFKNVGLQTMDEETRRKVYGRDRTYR